MLALIEEQTSRTCDMIERYDRTIEDDDDTSNKNVDKDEDCIDEENDANVIRSDRYCELVVVTQLETKQEYAKRQKLNNNTRSVSTHLRPIIDSNGKGNKQQKIEDMTHPLFRIDDLQQSLLDTCS